jgi:diguanylate cyclase (GGDEF)-like protein
MKILLVDDSPSATLVMSARLRRFCFDVVVAADGLAAVDAFVAHAPDLVLMDLEMPGINGLQATQRIRAEEVSRGWPWTPIIFLTASDRDDNLVTAIEAGADDFIPKSVAEPVLLAKMKAMNRVAALRRSLHAANARLQRLAEQDGLTGLANRRSLDSRVAEQWRLGQRAGQPLGVIMLDIDHFKRYNDFAGHLGGDDCLRQVAAAVGAEARRQPGAFAARYGGEEFIVVAPGLRDAALAALGRRLVDAVRALALPHPGNPPSTVVTVSAGGASSARCEGSVGALIERADRTLYAAKSGGRNRYVAAE